MSIEKIVGEMIGTSLLGGGGGNRVRELEAEVLLLQSQLLQKDAQLAGLRAQVKALKAECPNSKLLADNGQVYSDPELAGIPKSDLSLIYEAAHDKAARERGVADPRVIRAN